LRNEMSNRNGVRQTGLVALGFVGGLAVGMAAWSTQLHRSRRELFSGQPWRRLAALGYLGGCRPSQETARLLADYVSWESRPALRRRGERLLRRLEHYLD
ncbi:MAG TPA: hypothetical protein VEA99_04775, partial [Gemmatimonadaceae bacterium]|nr:hypothetical protein [Gemmatimonadaceae bacterium]